MDVIAAVSVDGYLVSAAQGEQEWAITARCIVDDGQTVVVQDERGLRRVAEAQRERDRIMRKRAVNNGTCAAAREKREGMKCRGK